MAKSLGSFEQYVAAIDKIVVAKTGLGYDDLPDLISVRDLYDDGVSAASAARDVIRAAKREYGF